MVRLRVRDFVQENAPHLTMTELGRLANIAQTTMIKVWKDPENTDVLLTTLIPISQALSTYLGRKVRVTELIEDE